MDPLQELAEKICVCELHKFGSKPVPGKGSVNAKLIFIGEAPNTQSERAGEPFIGWTGRALDQWLECIEISRSEVYVTNAVKCVLRDSSGKVDRGGYGPLNHQLLKCRKWLNQELDLVKAKIIVTVGSHALNSILNVSVGTFQEKGYCQKIKDRFYCALFHPGRHANVFTIDEKKVLDEICSLMRSTL